MAEAGAIQHCVGYGKIVRAMVGGFCERGNLGDGDDETE